MIPGRSEIDWSIFCLIATTMVDIALDVSIDNGIFQKYLTNPIEIPKV